MNPSSRIMDIVVTGGSGFLGREVISYLEKKGHYTYPMLMKGVKKGELERILRGDITDPSSFSFPRCDAVIHCAGILESSHPSQEKMMKVNFEGTQNVFREGKSKGIQKFIFISTISALGPLGSRKRPMTEEMEPHPTDIYGRSKLMAERYLEKAADGTNVTPTILRPSVLYGPGMNPNSSGMKIFTSINKGIMPLVGDGGNTLNMLFVDNLVHAIGLALRRDDGCRVYHVSERSYTQKEVIETIEKRMNKKGHRRYPRPLLWALAYLSETLSPLFRNPPPFSWTKYNGLTKDIWTMSSDRIRKELDYSEIRTLREGVDITCSYYGW